MSKSEVEQRYVLHDDVPTFSEYWNFRMGTSAVRVALALNEFSCDTELQPEFRDGAEMKQIWVASNAIISM
ncbi:MAG: hypothetical protein Q9162_003546 [Coniocarpon cinnabarinum]